MRELKEWGVPDFRSFRCRAAIRPARMHGMAMASLFDRVGGRPILEQLVTTFYDRAQQDPVLGPIFAAEVCDWPEHIQTVTNFWSTQTGGPPLYRGGMGKHLRLGLQAEHFARWLALWEENARREMGPEIAAEFAVIGRVFAERLKEMARQTVTPAGGFRFIPNAN